MITARFFFSLHHNFYVAGQSHRALEPRIHRGGMHHNTGLVIGPFRAAAPQKFSRGFIMAWRSHGATNKELVEKLASNGLIKSDRVKQAMLRVDTIIKNDG